MAETKWTAEQLNAINSLDGTVVVSAAAGSGKTAVLIERIINRLTREDNPCNANQLLIVTFTRAATAEMRSRLSSAISEMLKTDPHNQHLQNQQLLIPSADICTIDSFCCNLVRDNFNELGIAPDFRLLDSTESDILKSDALNETIDYYFEKYPEEFTELAANFKTNFGEGSIGKVILNLYTYSRAYPSPNAWLDSTLELYGDSLDTDNPLFDYFFDYIYETARYYSDSIPGIIDYFESAKNFEPKIAASCDKKIDLFTNEQAYLDTVAKAAKKRDIDRILETLEILPHPFPTYSQIKSIKDEQEYLNNKWIRNQYKEFLKNLSESITATLDKTRDINREMRPMVETLINAVKAFDRNYMDKKKRENALDFSDAELLALQLLVEDPASDTPVLTPLAGELSEKYEEILIDEYQDTNRLQDLLFCAISKNENNMFMVGDVKQSIYRFRQAMPDILIGKKDRFTPFNADAPVYPAALTLGKNFRSRKGILDATNYIFTQMMSRKVGDVDYDENEMLYFGKADCEEKAEPDVDLHIVETGDLNTKEASIIEAKEIAKYISEEIEKTQHSAEPLTFRDFTILLRSPGSNGKDYADVLSAYGIPVYLEKSDKFFQSADVITISSMLKVIDNPLYDVPLSSVMLSPLFGFTPDDLASYRLDSRYGSLYSAVTHAAESGDAKCKAFIETISYYKTLSVSLTSGELIRQIYEDTALPSIVGAMENGNARVANLNALIACADTYDSVSSYGLSGFVRYLQRLEDSDSDPAVPGTVSSEANVVKIMSMHKSKGLQFRVCILAGLSRNFNKRALSDSLLLHPKYGIGIKIAEDKADGLRETLLYSAIKVENSRSEQSENLRTLYVAMTRAKEKLVMFGTVGYLPNKPNGDPGELANIASAINFIGSKERVHPFLLLDSSVFFKNFFQMLLLGYARHHSMAYLFDEEGIDIGHSLPGEEDILITVHRNCTEAEENVETELLTVTEPAAELVEDIRHRTDYVYPFAELANTVSKRSASGLYEEVFNDEFFASSRPKFMSSKGLTPAERGTALHQFMQYADFQKAEADPALEVERLKNLEFITPEQASAIDTQMVYAFFNSEVAKRIKKAASLSPDNVMREKKFAILTDAGLFDQNLSKKLSCEQVLIQGIADLVFIEDNELVIVDYKTDRVSDEETLANLYKDQLEIYREALSKVLGMPIKETLLYSFHLAKEITVYSKPTE